MKQTIQASGLGVHWQAAFKDADIRGEVDTEITEGLAYKVAIAFVHLFSISKIAVGADMRLSSPSLVAAFIAGAQSAGADVINLGLITTPMLYFMSGQECIHGVMITASHNPKNYNGFKLVFPGAIPLTNATGLSAIKKFIQKDSVEISEIKGSVKRQNIRLAYAAYVSGKVTRPKKKLRILVDVGNGMGSLLIPILKKYATVTTLFDELDGAFPNRDSNPTLKKSQRAITTALKDGLYDMGIAFDGDADRVAFFSETGAYINAAHIGAFLAQHFLRQHPGATIISTTMNSRSLVETIESTGGNVVMSKVGHAFIKEKMRAEDAYFGCENSAHFYFKDNFYADSGILTVLHLLAAASPEIESGTSFGALLKPFAPYTQTEEMLVFVKDKDAALVAVKDWAKNQTNTKVQIFDGVVINSADWWGSVKKSVTEDALKFVVESPKRAIARKQQFSILSVLKNN